MFNEPWPTSSVELPAKAPNPHQTPAVVERIRRLEAVTDGDEIFDRFGTLAARNMRAPLAIVSLLREEDQIVKGLQGIIPEPFLSQRRLPYRTSLCQHVQNSGQALTIPDTREHPLVCDSPSVTQFGIQAYLGVPLITTDGYVLGAFCVMDYRVREWTPEDVDLLRGWASLIMVEFDLRLSRSELLDRFTHLQASESRRNERTRLLVHDLRTPLNSLLLGLRTLPLLGDLNEDQKESFNLALRGGKTLVQLVDDLLDAEAAEEEGAASLRISANLDTGQLVAQAVAQVTALAVNRGVTLSVEARTSGVNPPQPVTFDADADKLVRALVNLLSNAVKFTPSGGQVKIAAYPTKKTDGEWVVFSVRDTGVGIAPKDLRRIFERYVHLEPAGQIAQRSSGLGLSFVKAVAEAHGGRADVESAVGQGSVFRLILPRHQPLRS